MAQQDYQSSDSDEEPTPLPPPPPKSKQRRSRDDVSRNETCDSRTRTSRRPSERQENINKENLQTTEQKLLKAQKELEKAKRQLRKAANTETPANDDAESEEEDEEDIDPGVTSFKSSIRAMQPLPAEAPRPTTVLRKRSDPRPPPKTSSRAYLALPEISAGPNTSPPASPQHYNDRVDDVSMDLDDLPLSPRGAAATPRRATESHSDSHSHHDSTPSTSTHDRGRPAVPDTMTRKRHLQSSPAPPPPPKRKRKEPKFAEGFVVVAGVKSKASDYESEVKALILRGCNEYAVRILIINAFPDSALQTQWGKECFRNACRAAQKFYSSTTRIITLITRRGSHTRSLIVQACRTGFAAHYAFNRSSTSAAVMVTNSKLSEKLRADAAFHYKDIDGRTGYGGNPILAEMRHVKLFEAKNSLGAIFAAKFDPYPLPTLALEFAALEHCAKEWSTGKFVSADFSEKYTLESYKVHLKDIEAWNSLNEQVVKNIRHKWFLRATRKLELPTTPEGASHLDSTQKDVLRDELAGRTGETDSEPEPDADAV